MLETGEKHGSQLIVTEVEEKYRTSQRLVLPIYGSV
jgi:hypothetical protein